MTFVEDIVLHSFQVRLRFSESVLEVLLLSRNRILRCAMWN